MLATLTYRVRAPLLPGDGGLHAAYVRAGVPVGAVSDEHSAGAVGAYRLVAEVVGEKRGATRELRRNSGDWVHAARGVAGPAGQRDQHLAQLTRGLTPPDPRPCEVAGRPGEVELVVVAPSSCSPVRARVRPVLRGTAQWSGVRGSGWRLSRSARSGRWRGAVRDCSS